MHCLVDFRNRPLLDYSFHSREKAREYLRKIKNNPLGVTVIHRDGRREYFEHGLPRNFSDTRQKTCLVKKGFHIRYFLRELNTLDGARSCSGAKGPSLSKKGWRIFDSWPIFMLGNRKFLAGAFTLTLLIFSSAYFFEKSWGANSPAAPSQTEGVVLGMVDSRPQLAEAGSDATNASALKLADEDVIFNLLGKIKEEKQDQFASEILTYLKGKPMADMAPYIAEEPRTVAAFLVGIAMKESKFGLYAPHASDGSDCHNYWGYRGPENTTASGYSCFSNPQQAVVTVGKRIAKLVNQGASNPSEMVVWKCGASCSWDDPANVRKWIADVGINFYKINS